MTWVDVERNILTHASSADAPVVVGVSKRGKIIQRVLVTVRKLDTPLEFWKLGAMVRVQVGSDTDAGKIRITPNGPHKLGCVGGSKRTPWVTLQFPLPAGIVTNGEPKTPVEYDYNDTWLEVTLPAWAKASPPPPAGKSAALAAGIFQTTATIGKGPRPATGGR